MFGGGMDGLPPGIANMGNAGLGPEQAEGLSDAKTEEETGWDSDALLDEPIENAGDVSEVTWDKKVMKEILRVGEGKKRPKRAYIAKVKYSLYFFDHTPIASTGDNSVEIVMGDISVPEGLWKGLEKMRKNEIAKVKIQKKYSFGRKELREKLVFPEGFGQDNPENHEKITTKGVIYEVELLDWTERIDVNGDSVFIKQIISKCEKKTFLKPKDIDEVTIDVTVKQNDKLMFEKKDWTCLLIDAGLTPTIKQVLESMKREEHSKTVVEPDWVKGNDPVLEPLLEND